MPWSRAFPAPACALAWAEKQDEDPDELADAVLANSLALEDAEREQLQAALGRD